MDIKELVNSNKEEIINILKELVSYNSVENKNEQGTPFGVINSLCLKRALEIGESFGLKSKNLDNYCGYLEIGEGNKTIGIATHLDIVPVGNNWNTDPFTLTEKDGYLYGRGTSDDKGAASCMIVALKILKNLNIPINKKIRLIFGCNEETGSLCMKHYNKVEGPFDYGFTPDSEFPCVNGEKGHIKCSFNCNETTIIDIKGGNAFNAVCDKCFIEIPINKIDKEAFITYMNDNNLKVDINEEETLKINVIGKAAHASMPYLGINAITYSIYGLKEAGYDDPFINSYCELFDLDNSGSLLNIKCNDKYGDLTLVNGVINKKEETITGTIDIRVPVTYSTKEIVNTILKKENNIKINIDSYEESLFFEENSFLVNSLMTAYKNVTKDYNAKPSVSGGGTYAKSLQNCIAFGCEFPNNENNIHDANERVKIDELLLQTELYINAIIELLK